VSFTIPAGSDTAVFSDGEPVAGFQPGTVAGTLTFSAEFASGGEDVTPAEPPTATAEVAGGPPVITSVAAENVTPTGFTIVVSGFSTIRQVTGATFNFTPVSGVELNPSSVSPNVTAAFQTWFDGEESAGFGSTFTLTMPFTIGGEQNAIQSVSVTLSNSQGTSAPASVSLR
jgi:hypothetical protein